MAVATPSARNRRRGLQGFPAGMQRNPFNKISELGRAAFASRPQEIKNKELVRRPMPIAEEFEGKRFNPLELNDVIEYSEIALQRQNEEMIKKTVLFVAGWKDLSRVREFFQHFFKEEQHPAMQQYGVQLYLGYLNSRGNPLGGKFAEFDKRFAESRRRNRR